MSAGRAGVSIAPCACSNANRPGDTSSMAGLQPLNTVTAHARHITSLHLHRFMLNLPVGRADQVSRSRAARRSHRDRRRGYFARPPSPSLRIEKRVCALAMELTQCIATASTFAVAGDSAQLDARGHGPDHGPAPRSTLRRPAFVLRTENPPSSATTPAAAGTTRQSYRPTRRTLILMRPCARVHGTAHRRGPASRLNAAVNSAHAQGGLKSAIPAPIATTPASSGFATMRCIIEPFPPSKSGRRAP